MPSFNASRRRFLSGMGGLALTAAAPSDDALRVSVAEFGVAPGLRDVGPGVRKAIARLDKRPGSTLHFPRGAYSFGQQDGVAMLFDDMDHLTVEGEDATLLFNGAVAPLLMRGCRSPSLRGITFDWERPPFSQGEVTEVGADQTSLILRIDPEFPVDGNERIQHLGTYDRSIIAMKMHGIDDMGSVKSVALIGNQLLYLTLKRPVPFKVGDTLVGRHGNSGPPVVELQNCQNFAIHNLAIHAAPAMAIAISGCDGGSVTEVSVEPLPGSVRLMSSNADGLHCASCSGIIEIADSTFGGMGDDGINVTGLYLAAKVDNDERVLVLTGGQYAPAPSWAAPRVGDHLLLVNGMTLRPVVEVAVERIEKRDVGKWAVQTPSNFLEIANEPLFAINLNARTQLHVTNCRFPGNRARGILAHSDAIIESCTFRYQSAAAILLAPDMYWQEGPAIERVVVRGNDVQASNLLGQAAAAVWIGAFVSPGGQHGVATSEVVNRNVTIQSNVFVQPNGPAVAAAATADLRIGGNQVEHSSHVAFSLQNVRATRLEQNLCEPAATVRVDASSRSEVTMNGNVGLSIE